MNTLLARLGLRPQLVALVAVLIAFTLGIGLLGLAKLSGSDEALRRVNEERMASIDKLKHISDAYAVSIVDTSHKTRNGNIGFDEAQRNVRDARARVAEKWKAYTSLPHASGEAGLIGATEGLLLKVDGTVDALEDILARKDPDALVAFTRDVMYPAIDPLTAKLDQLIDVQLEAGDREYAQARADYSAARSTLIALIAAALLAGTALALFIIARAMRALGTEPAEARAIAARIATGDLAFPLAVPEARRDSLLGALHRMKDSLLHSKLYYEGQIKAISLTQAVVELEPDGTVVGANELFLKLTGWTLEDLRGKHHGVLVDDATRGSAEHRDFWATLAAGRPHEGVFRRVARDGSELWLRGAYNPIVDADGQVFRVVMYATDVTAARLAGQMNAAFKGALDTLNANVMVADNDGRIIYLNEAGKALMHDVQPDLRRDLPQFDAARLVGQNMDVFHRNPAHQRGMIERLTGRHEAQIAVGGRTMRLIANPMRGEDGRRLGAVVEWFDRTQELATEEELQRVVGAVVQGDFGSRISLAGKRGFFETLSRGLNELVDNVGTVVSEVRDLVAAANSGDLTRRMATEGRSGLLVTIGGGINQLTDNLSQLVAQVKQAASEVSRGADEISQGNTNLSQRTEEQASSLEETASSMEQMTSTVKQNADNAQQANQLAIAARDQAERGGVVVEQAVAAMSGINECSKRIADIIGVIDEIAFQTNLLALNAAVEAARAGEQGRGFAVVASEVRNLAGRSATAAKEIKGLIQDSVRRVDEGSQLVQQSGTTLGQIVASVKRVTDIVAEISAASHEQSAGIDQVNKAVMQLDELTQQNAALVEEASAASEAMAEQARGLAATLARYTVMVDARPPVERTATTRAMAGRAAA